MFIVIAQVYSVGQIGSTKAALLKVATWKVYVDNNLQIFLITAVDSWETRRFRWEELRVRSEPIHYQIESRFDALNYLGGGVMELHYPRQLS